MAANTPDSLPPLPGQTPQVDTGQIERKASEDALVNQPPSDAREPGPYEQGLIGERLDKYNILNRWAVENTRGMLKGFADREGEIPPRRDFEAAVQKSDSAVEEYLQGTRQGLLEAQADYAVAFAHWRFFRWDRKIQEEAKYPVSTHLHFALLVLFVLLEAVLNSFFFAESQSLGIIGGISIAVFISLVSIGSGFFAGYFLYPQAAHGRGDRQWSCRAAIALWAVTILCVHLLVAHYRDLSSLKSAIAPLLAPAQAAPSHALHHPFDLSVLSIVMFLIGVILSALAFIDGSRCDDPHPGYGHLDRRLKQARATRDAAVQAVRLGVAERIKTAAAETTRLRILATSLLVRLRELAAMPEPLQKSYDERLSPDYS